jgi:hypothetical protein
VVRNVRYFGKLAWNRKGQRHRVGGFATQIVDGEAMEARDRRRHGQWHLK